MKIIDITPEVIPPLNILPNGQMDPTKDHWMFGGTIYHVNTKHYVYQVQLENGLWCDAAWNCHHKSLKALLLKVDELNKDYEQYCLTNENLKLH